MPRNGSGAYSLPAGNPVVTGTTITTTWANGTLSDIATALTGSLAADGQTVATANLQMGGFKLVNCAAGSSSGEPMTFGQAVSGTTGTFSGAVSSGGQVSGTSAAISGALTALSGAFSSSLTAPTVTAGDSSNNVATTAFVASTAFSSALPAINTTTKGATLTNNGSSGVWGDPTLSAQAFFFAQF